MYLDFYQLKRKPFHVAPDPEFLFLSPSHKEALSTIIYGIEERKGFVAIIGEVGVGKTTILHTYFTQVDPTRLKTIYFFSPNISFSELLDTIYHGLGLEVIKTEAILDRINHLYHALLTEYQAGRNVAVVIDEAQNMPIETLENLRMLSNLETPKEKLLQIVLVGQPELEQKLQLHALRQLRQRIAIRATITPLTQAESMVYIQHRLAKVTLKKEPIFTQKALKKIVKHAKGIPRTVNILCDNALMAGCAYHQKPIPAHIISEVIAGLDERKRHPFRRWGRVGVGTLVLLLGLWWGISYQSLIFTTIEHLDLSPITQLIPTLFYPSKTQFPGGEESTKPAAESASLPTSAKTTSPPEEIKSPEFLPPEQVGQDERAAAARTTQSLTPDHAEPMTEQPPEALLPKQQENPHQPEIVIAVTPETQQEKPLAQNVPASPQNETAVPIIKTVQPGDSLTKLIMGVYGFHNERLIDWVKKHNPHIRDIHKIVVGEKIVFPPFALIPEQRKIPKPESKQ